jgi:hypothetical protein
MPIINPLKPLVIPTQTQKKSPPKDSQPPSPTSQKIRLFGKYICILGMVDFNPPRNWWVSLLLMHELKHGDIGKSWFCHFKNPIPGFERLGLELDNCGRTTENDHCCIYSLWHDRSYHEMSNWIRSYSTSERTPNLIFWRNLSCIFLFCQMLNVLL